MRGVEYSYIDLTFNGLAAHREELKALLKDMLGEQYAPQFGIHKAGNSAVLRLIAPKYLDWQIPFEEQIDVVEDHLRLVALLCETAKQIGRERLSAFYTVAAPEKLKRATFVRTNYAASRIHTFRLRTVGRTLLPDRSQREREGLYVRATGCVGEWRSGFESVGCVFPCAQNNHCSKKWRNCWFWGHG